MAKSSTSAISLVSSLTRYGRSPLHMACCTGKEEAVKVLLQLRPGIVSSVKSREIHNFFQYEK